MEGRLDVFDPEVKRRVELLVNNVHGDKFAEVEVRFGKIVRTPRYSFDTNIGNRALKRIMTLLSSNTKWTDKTRTETTDAFYTHADGKRYRVTTLANGEKIAVQKIRRDFVDIELPNMPFDIRVSHSSEIPANVDEVCSGDVYVRKKRRDRFNSRNMFYYDATKVTSESKDGYEEPLYEFEIEMNNAMGYLRSRGTKYAASSLLLKTLDIQKIFM